MLAAQGGRSDGGAQERLGPFISEFRDLSCEDEISDL